MKSDAPTVQALWAPSGGHRTLAEKAYAALHDAILSGQLAPGERLRIEQLAETLDMSPMPIREAIRRLDAAGLVELAPHKATRVAELSLDDLSEVYQARLALEPLAVRLAAESFTDEVAAAASASLERYVEAYKQNDPSAIWTAHTDFHYTLYRQAGSRWLLRLITPIWESSERYRRASIHVERNLGERQSEHEAILAACVERDPDRAAREMWAHLALTANLLARAMGGDELFRIEREEA
jgi:DNA-binding GntR family transcriptional regulator